MNDLYMGIENEIIDKLLYDINNGVYNENEKMPSENDLASKYEISRIKVRNIYKKLEKMGYLYSLQGRGRFLKRRTKTIELVLSGNESFSKKLKENGFKLETINICCEKIEYNKHIYNELRADEDDEIYKIARLRIVDDEPIAIHISYVSKKIFPNIDREGEKITSMFDYYEKNGFKNYMTEKSILEIAYASVQERIYLKCEDLVPILKLETNCTDKNSQKILEYTEIIYRSDRFKYKIY